MSNRRFELFLRFALPASHSLDEREERHRHDWKVQVGVTGPLEDGRIVSMPALREALEPAVGALRGTFLNENPCLSAEARAYPTCEYLALYFESAFTECLAKAQMPLALTRIEVAVDEIEGTESASAALTLV